MKEKEFIDWENPSDYVVNAYCHRFDTEYYKSEQTISAAFQKNDLYNRMKTLNATYKTRLKEEDIKALASYAASCRIDDKIQKGEIDSVELLANKDKVKGLRKNCFSFATKYCCIINPFSFPIFDSFVVKSLLILNWKYHFSKTRLSEKTFNDLRSQLNYRGYKEIVDEFKDFPSFGLSNFSYRIIDKYLWWNPVFSERQLILT